MKRRDVLMGAAAAAAPPFAARAAAFPTRPIKLLVGFAPGGTQDVLARGVAETAGKALGQPVIVEHRAGAAGRIAAEAVKNAEPDGHTLLLATGAMMSLYPHVYQDLRYDPLKDFAPIVGGARFELAMNVHPSVPANNMGEFVKWARARGENGSGVSYASYGAGTPSHFLGEMLNQAAGLKMVHIPYRGSLPARQDLLGGQVPLFFDVVGQTMSYLQERRVKVLATSGFQRSPFLLQIPTFIEQGYKDIQADAWFAFMAPARTPPSIVQRLTAEFGTAVNSRPMRTSLVSSGLFPSAGTPEGVTRLIREDLARWGRVVRLSGFKATD